jgi:hypothetical protein
MTMNHLIGSAARPADAFELDLREEDQAEVSEGWRTRAANAIEEGNAQTYRDAAGSIVGIFGVTFPLDGVVSPWLLCSPLLAQHRREALRRGRRMIDAIRRAAPDAFVFNHIPKAATSNRRFVQAMGFRVVPSGESGLDLIYFPEASGAHRDSSQQKVD